MKEIKLDELPGLIGQEFTGEEWTTVTQEQIDQFAAATGDHQWIHVDPERAAAGPFGKTIAHGFLTLSMTVILSNNVMQFTGVRMGINYGLDKVRFITPVPVGSRLRAKIKLADLTEVPGGGVQLTRIVTVELEGAEKPACVAESLVRLYA